MKKLFYKISKFLDKIDDATVDALLASGPIRKIEESALIKRARDYCGITIK